MSWLNDMGSWLSDRALSFVLDRYLSKYVAGGLSVDQIKSKLLNGKLDLHDINLEIDACNDLAKSANLPAEIVSGYVRKVEISIPSWTTWHKESCHIEVTGLRLTLKPKRRASETCSSVLQSSSLSNVSSNLAKTILENVKPTDEAEPLESVETFAEKISSIIRKLEIKFRDSLIRFEHAPPNLTVGLALEIRIDNFEFFDDLISESSFRDTFSEVASSSCTIKRVYLEGVSFYVDEFSRECGVRESTVESSSIIFAELSGRQEIRVKRKQTKNFSGLHLDISVSLDYFTSFLGPRQVHALFEVLSEFSFPTEEVARSKFSPKNMEVDFEQLENELSSEMEPFKAFRRSDLRKAYGWSGIDKSDNKSGRPGVSSMKSPPSDHFVSEINFSDRGSPRWQRERLQNEDVPLETIQIQIRVESVAVVLLHNDFIKTATENMKSIAERYFEIERSGESRLKKSKFFRSTCQRSHLRLSAAASTVQVDHKISRYHSSSSGSLTLDLLDVIECFVERASDDEESVSLTFIELFTFDKDNLNETDFEMKFDFSKKAAKNHPHIDFRFSINLSPCHAEFDVTLIDRISSLLNYKPITAQTSIYGQARSNFNQQSLLDDAAEIPSSADFKLNLRISATKFGIKIRFPIPDLRPMMDRAPWWNRSVRPDYATLHLTDGKFSTEIKRSNRAYSADHEVQCRDFLLTYTEEGSDLPVEIGKSTSDQDFKSPEGLSWPRVLINICPERVKPVPLDNNFDDENDSKRWYKPSPFSSVPAYHESGIRRISESENADQQTENRTTEELVIPGSREEMTEFIDVATRSSKIKIDIVLPRMSVLIPSNRTLELIYNRFSKDLLMWEPSAPGQKIKTNAKVYVYQEVPTSMTDSFYPGFVKCEKGRQSDSDSSESDEQTNPKSEQKSDSTNGQSKISLTLTIHEGLLTLLTPVRDSMQEVIPDKRGEVILQFREATAFFVSNYKGDDKLGYFCSMVECAEVYNCGPVPLSSQVLRSADTVIPDHCLRTVYRNESGANINAKSIRKDTLRVAVEIRASEYTPKVNTLKIAVGLNNTTFKHKDSDPLQSLFKQIKDCLDVKSYPVIGHNPEETIMELHCNISDCIVDYRPLNLPLRSLIYMGKISTASKIAADTDILTLRFITEDIGLFLSNKTATEAVNLKNDYVCVVDLDLFELWLRFNKNMCSGIPIVDLRASNNILHLRTCSDSCLALLQLIIHSFKIKNVSSNSDDTEDVEKSSKHTISESQMERVTSLLEDAMEDIGDDKVSLSPVNVTSKNTSEASAKTDKPEINDDDDEDFCMLGEEIPGVTAPSLVESLVRRFETDKKIDIVDDQFSIPQGQPDVLRAPKENPPPSLKYTVRDITFVWHIYAGKDFKDKDPASKNSTSPTKKSNAAASQLPQKQVSESSKRRGQDCQESKNWRVICGQGRQGNALMELQLNKMSYRYEAYPVHEKISAHQVFAVREFEIRDRLPYSEINKFLHLHTSSDMPKRNFAHMFKIKIRYMRPESGQFPEGYLQFSILPLKLNIDQDSLLFIINFFTEITKGFTENQGTRESIAKFERGSPIMSIVDDEKDVEDLKEQCGDEFNVAQPEYNEKMFYESGESNQPTFFRNVEFTSGGFIKLDFHVKNVVYDQGNIAHLITRIGNLHDVELELKKFSCSRGLLGYERVLRFILQEWTIDLKNQSTNFLGGLAPIKIISKLYEGVRDLIWIPVQQYHIDGNIIHGLQRGTSNFYSNTSYAFLKLVDVIHTGASATYDLIDPSSIEGVNQTKKKKRRYNQPLGIRQGISNAREVVTEGFGSTYEQLVQVASEEHESVAGAVGGVLRQLAPAVVSPIVICSEATSNVLGGMVNELVPDAKREATQKWKKNDDFYQK